VEIDSLGNECLDRNCDNCCEHLDEIRVKRLDKMLGSSCESDNRVSESSS